jgi:hypothetical protein
LCGRIADAKDQCGADDGEAVHVGYLLLEAVVTFGPVAAGREAGASQSLGNA